jgi:hypothetical protein
MAEWRVLIDRLYEHGVISKSELLEAIAYALDEAFIEGWDTAEWINKKIEADDG